jgi:hypothetical protein
MDTTTSTFTFAWVFNGPATAGTETFNVQIAAAPANTSVASNGDLDTGRQLIITDLGPQ